MTDILHTSLHAAPRDYSLTGPSSKQAIDAGLSAAEWYHTDVPRKTMKRLMQRRDGPAMRDTAIWVLLHFVFAVGGTSFWGSWAAVPFWIAYGVSKSLAIRRLGCSGERCLKSLIGGGFCRSLGSRSGV